MNTEKRTITEIVTFTTADTYSDDEITAIVKGLATGFLPTLEGFEDAELVKGSEAHQWIMILHWASQEAVDALGNRFSTAAETEEYRNALTTVSLHFTPQVGSWSAA